MVSDVDRQVVANSFAMVIPIADTIADHFYRRLFELRPEYAELFGDEKKLGRQKRKWIQMFQIIAESVSWSPVNWREEVDVEDDLCLLIMALGKRHVQVYNIPEEAYGPFGEALLFALQQGLGDDFTPEVRASWARLYRTLALTMRMGADCGKVEIQLGRL